MVRLHLEGVTDCPSLLLSACSNRVLSSSGQLGVPRVEKPHVTEPKPFNLRSDSRARMRRSHEQPTMQQAAGAAHFKAQPLNRSILDGPVRGAVGACVVAD
jgi:targeting protein for Xklp2